MATRYRWKCSTCKNRVEAPVSGYYDDINGLHVHCPICGNIRYVECTMSDQEIALSLILIIPMFFILLLAMIFSMKE